MLSQSSAQDAFKTVFEEWHEHCHPENGSINRLDMWMRGTQGYPNLPFGATMELRVLAQESKNPWGHLIVSAPAQQLYVEGYRKSDSQEQSLGWKIWQANRLDSAQSALHRGAIGHGLAFAVVLPGSPNPLTGETIPSMRGVSAKRMTALYDDFGDWPMLALEGRPNGKDWLFSLYDEEAVYYFATKGLDFAKAEYISAAVHGAPVTPVVRYASHLNLEGKAHGEIKRLIPLLERLDRDVFDRMLAQRFASWKVRYATGMAKPETEDEERAVNAYLRMGDLLVNESTDAKFGTLESTDLAQFVSSEEADLRALASISQVPPTQLMGQVANLSAEALAASEENLTRKVEEFKHSLGEAHEQALGLGEWYMTGEYDTDSQVRWADMSARSLSATADALGKLAVQLGVPVQMLWEMIPGWSQTDVARADALRQAGDPVQALQKVLDGQNASLATPAVTPPASGGPSGTN